MDIVNLEVTSALIAQKFTKIPQLFQVTAIADLHAGSANLVWHFVTPDGQVGDSFASASVEYGNARAWLADWARVAHLVRGRIEALEQLAEKDIANKLSRSMTYRLFNNLVDYAEKYRGMHSVILSDFEAVADVTLSSDKSGTWTVPPHYIDSVAHLAGFIMNASDANDTINNFFVTPGWKSMRFAKPLLPAGKYQSYVKMLPTEDPTIFTGDVYILEGSEIIGMVGSITFRRYPRILLNKFFDAPDAKGKTASAATKPLDLAHLPPVVVQPLTKNSEPCVNKITLPTVTASIKASPVPIVTLTASPHAVTPARNEVETAVAEVCDQESIAARAIALIANEAALEIADVHDEAQFASLGIDSLMSLVIAEKFREELQVTVSGSLFLEYPTVGDLKAWLVEYYS